MTRAQGAPTADGSSLLRCSCSQSGKHVAHVRVTVLRRTAHAQQGQAPGRGLARGLGRGLGLGRVLGLGCGLELGVGLSLSENPSCTHDKFHDRGYTWP